VKFVRLGVRSLEALWWRVREDELHELDETSENFNLYSSCRRLGQNHGVG
jgi:hypothetical protein